jgi:ABC-type transporter Mla MlaB component
MNSKSTKKSKNILLKLGPNLTIENTAEVHTQYIKALDQNKDVDLKVTQFENIDLTGIQLLLLLKSSAHITNLSKIKFSFSETSADLIKKCGFSKLLD